MASLISATFLHHQPSILNNGWIFMYGNVCMHGKGPVVSQMAVEIEAQAYEPLNLHYFFSNWINYPNVNKLFWIGSRSQLLLVLQVKWHHYIIFLINQCLLMEIWGSFKSPQCTHTGRFVNLFNYSWPRIGYMLIQNIFQWNVLTVVTLFEVICSFGRCSTGKSRNELIWQTLK